MTEREKLIELLNKQSCPSPLLCDKNCKYAHLQTCYPERVADHLLANEVGFVPIGRNISEIHPVDEFVCSECGFICEGWTEVVYDEDTGDVTNYEFEFRYCPKCGCKLEDF